MNENDNKKEKNIDKYELHIGGKLRALIQNINYLSESQKKEVVPLVTNFLLKSNNDDKKSKCILELFKQSEWLNFFDEKQQKELYNRLYDSIFDYENILVSSINQMLDALFEEKEYFEKYKSKDDVKIIIKK